jgi:hypothetical protein
MEKEQMRQARALSIFYQKSRINCLITLFYLIFSPFLGAKMSGEELIGKNLSGNTLKG